MKRVCILVGVVWMSALAAVAETYARLYPVYPTQGAITLDCTLSESSITESEQIALPGPFEVWPRVTWTGMVSRN